jgi:CDP-paratose 2-epimerase
VQKALEQKLTKAGPFTISGNGKQVRDVLFASDMVSLYLSAASTNNFRAGNAYNIGGGVSNSLSLLELFRFLETELKIELDYQEIDWRSSDQKVFIADIRKVGESFGWSPEIEWRSGIRSVIDWVGFKIKTHY